MKNKDRKFNAANQVSPKPAWGVVTGSHVGYHKRKLLVETVRKTQAAAWAALGSQDKIDAAKKRGAMVLALVVSAKTRAAAVDWQSRALASEAEVERLRAFAETVYWLLPSGEDPAQVSPGLHKAQFGWAFNMRVFTPEIRGQMTPQELHILEALEKVVGAWTK